ncbi:fumA, partial [Symbiodinium sp. KB8]
MPDGTKKVKSRLCARGCFDRQKDLLSTRSTTATRLSQRLLLSTAANEDLDAESWDISGAFLKGMNFEAVRRLLEQKGIKSPKRKIAIIAPANVWRHLAFFDKRFAVEPTRLGDFILLCIKPVCGLSDAPLAWQLCLHGHFEEQGGKPSLMDENSFYWCEPPSYRTTSMVTTHVDDCGAAGKPAWLKAQYELLVKKFGKVTRQQLPFDHCGVRYSKLADGFRMSQDDFCGKLRPAEVPKDRKDDDSLNPSELTLFRSILGGLLWLTATRLDLVADVCLLQSQVTRAKISHLRQANIVIKKAQSELGQGLGLHFRKLRRPHRLACIHDSSAAGNVRNYAQEGVLVLLCEDRLGEMPRDKEHTLSDAQCALMGGLGHILWAHGAKAKRISYSTSHAETLAGISGLEASTLVAVRIAEMFYLRRPASLQALIACQEYGVPQLPVDTYTDCRDFFELCSGNGNIPQDKNQRLYVLAYREARMSGRVRWMSLVPTQSMTADENHPVILRSLPVLPTIEEKHFDMTDRELVKDIAKGFMVLSGCSYKQRFICMALLMTCASATSTSSSTASSDDTGWYFMIAITLGADIWRVVYCYDDKNANDYDLSFNYDLGSTSIDDDIEKDKTTMLYIAGLEGENLQLRGKNKALDRELRHVNEFNFAQQAEIRRLQDARMTATNASSTEELFCT